MTNIDEYISTVMPCPDSENEDKSEDEDPDDENQDDQEDEEQEAGRTRWRVTLYNSDIAWYALMY